MQSIQVKTNTLIFDDDFAIPRRKITVTQHGYARIGNDYLHRLIMKPTRDEQVDHINHNKLDNRKANLRICSEYDNNKNRPADMRNTSGYVGVYFQPRPQSGKNWVANICIDGKTYYIGAYETPEEAATNRDSVAQQVFGTYASLNFKD